MIKRSCILFIVLCLHCYLSVFGTDFFNKDVRLLTMQDGLADNTVTCIYKDSDGFMWFGTGNGLSRYDGKFIRNFGIQPFYMNISEIHELSEKYLSVIADGHLYCFDRMIEKFIPIVYAADNSQVFIPHLLPVDETTFWAVTGHKLVLFQLQKEENKTGDVSIKITALKEYTYLVNDPENISAMCYSADHKRIWLVTDHFRLLRFNPESPAICESVQLSKNEFVRINSIMDDGEAVWVSTIQKGLICYHIESMHTDFVTYTDDMKTNRLSHTDVYQVISLNENQYLAATWSGYTLLIKDKEKAGELRSEIYSNTTFHIHRNLETRMISAFYDPEGVLWIGTSGGGVIYSDLRSQFYNQYHQERHNEICDILMDSDRRIWLATYHQGIMRSDDVFDPTRKLTFSTVGTPEIRNRQTVLSAIQDKEGNLWFGDSQGDLIFYDIKSKTFSVYSLIPDNTVQKIRIWALHIDRNDCFWIGAEEGLFMFDRKTKNCRRVPIEDQLLKKVGAVYVRVITETGDGSLWIGTSNAGVCRIRARGDNKWQVENGYEGKVGIEHWAVRSMLAASDGILYIGYMDGFAVLSPEENTISSFYTTRNGLCSNFIGCLVEDNKGRVWLGSNSGMSRYSRHQHLFYNYYIAGSNRSALFGEHMLFWGNNRSLTYFDPDDTEVHWTNEKVFITSLEVDGRPVGIGKEINGQIVLQKAMPYTQSIVLTNDNRDFSLTFNDLTYSKELQKYNYRLLPYQKQWLISGEGEKVSYTNLPEGKYTFEVKRIFPDGKNGDVTSLAIEILPHWSRTIAFRLLILGMLVGLVVYLLHRYQLKQKRLEHEMQMKQELFTANLERTKEKQIRMERENFFTSAAHELRTPLTLILSPLQELLQQINPSETIYNKIRIIYKNGSSLHTLVDHLLYVQKIEAGMVRLHLSEVDIVTLLKEVSGSFQQMSGVEGFTFEVNLPESPVLLWIDTEKVMAAVSNLLSNAFKYTSRRGKVSLSLNRTIIDGKNYSLIAVSDTGSGIPSELQERIFDSFVTGENASSFSTKVGIGLRIVKNTMDLHHGSVSLESAPGEGSTFILSIPEGREHFICDTYEITDARLEGIVKGMDIKFTPPATETRAENPETKKALLIIEDNKDIREYIAGLFDKKYRIIQAENGEEGVQMAIDRIPDMIISDIMMPVKDGFACCREIRQHQETAHIPILMLTAKAEDADVLQGSYSGADDYMMKPFNPEILKAKVESLVAQRERLKRIYTKALMLKQEDTEKGEVGDEFMQKVINVIESYLSDESFTVKVLAEQLNMSQPTLYRRIKQCSELSVIDIIRSVRVAKAASLIMENKYSVQEISEMVGYTDVRTLRKHFTEQFGVSPSKYMEKHSG